MGPNLVALTMKPHASRLFEIHVRYLMEAMRWYHRAPLTQVAGLPLGEQYVDAGVSLEWVIR
jgi:hypothetical protein